MGRAIIIITHPFLLNCLHCSVSVTEEENKVVTYVSLLRDIFPTMPPPPVSKIQYLYYVVSLNKKKYWFMYNDRGNL